MYKSTFTSFPIMLQVALTSFERETGHRCGMTMSTDHPFFLARVRFTHDSCVTLNISGRNQTSSPRGTHNLSSSSLVWITSSFFYPLGGKGMLMALMSSLSNLIAVISESPFMFFYESGTCLCANFILGRYRPKINSISG